MPGRVWLKKSKDKPVLARHPWIFSGAIERVDDVADGDTTDVFAAGGGWLARGYYNSRSQIAVRLWTWQSDERADLAFLRRRLQAALDRRRAMIDAERTDAFRLVNAESDLMPGLVVDRYADYLVVQFLTLGIDKRKQEIVSLLQELLAPRGVYERSDVDVREREGMSNSVGVLAGSEPPDVVDVHENGYEFGVNVRSGHKTGFYLDQRENRRRTAELLSHVGTNAPDGTTILNVFAYTGAFAVYICGANPTAHIINLDASRDALALARMNLRRNRFEPNGDFVEGDAFQILRKYRDEGKSFDAIILDPPKFVYSQAQMQSGLRGYKDINLLALKLLKPGGILVTFSCSGLVSAELFQKVVFGAALDAGRDAQIVASLLQAPDHPVLLSFPESEYLKGLVCRLV